MSDTFENEVTVTRGGFPALGSKVGLIQADVTIGGVMATAGDVNQVFEFESNTLVLCAGLTVLVPTTNTVDADLGLAGGAELLAASDVSAAAGTTYEGGYLLANVIIDAGDTLDLSISADAGAAGSVRVWALVADIGDAEG